MRFFNSIIILIIIINNNSNYNHILKNVLQNKIFKILLLLYMS
jgi:hypothetical protein